MLVPDDPRRRLVLEVEQYQIWHDPLVHRPLGLFRVWCRGVYIGAQLSMPCLTDCQWLERTGGKFAYQSAPEKSRALRGVAKNRSYSIHRRNRIEPEEELAA
ncbi:MAG TPA: hypothetical protein VFC18_16110 [Burkholderiales bacterium]|nr:hypothetical protein [Burkholderiales bacterium]